MLQCQVALLSRVAGCTSSLSYLGGWGRWPAYAQEVQASLNNMARSLSQKQHKPEFCPCHFTLVQTEQVCPSELKSHHDVRIPMWKQTATRRRWDRNDWLIQNTTLSEAGRLDLSNTKKMLNIHAWKQLINVLFPSVHFLLWCSRIKYCTVKPSSPHKNTMQGRNTGFPCSPGEVIFKGSRNRVGW